MPTQIQLKPVKTVEIEPESDVHGCDPTGASDRDRVPLAISDGCRGRQREHASGAERSKRGAPDEREERATEFSEHDVVPQIRRSVVWL